LACNTKLLLRNAFSALRFLHEVAAFFDEALRLLGKHVAGAALPFPANDLLPVDGDGGVGALLPLLVRVQALPTLLVGPN
jgi:hypothetical protein